MFKIIYGGRVLESEEEAEKSGIKNDDSIFAHRTSLFNATNIVNYGFHVGCGANSTTDDDRCINLYKIYEGRKYPISYTGCTLFFQWSGPTPDNFGIKDREIDNMHIKDCRYCVFNIQREKLTIIGYAVKDGVLERGSRRYKNSYMNRIIPTSNYTRYLKHSLNSLNISIGEDLRMLFPISEEARISIINELHKDRKAAPDYMNE